MTLTLHINPSQITKQGDTFSITGLPATPELEQAMKAKFSMWEPGLNAAFWFYIDAVGEVHEVRLKWWAHASSYIAAGNCFPTRELAEWQAEVEQITRRLNQAAVVRGGMLGSRHTVFSASVSYGGELCYFPYAFYAGDDCDKFNKDYQPDLTRLAELNALLSEGWQKALRGGEV